MPKIIGLTGGIGSGKTTIARHFELLGVPVYIADDESKKIMYTPEAVRELNSAFGDAAFTNGQPDRQKLAKLVFNDPEKLKILNAILHPKVQMHFREWVAAHNTHNFVIKEAAILFESGSYKDCDKIILITAPQEVRIERVMQRDAVSREKVLERIASQWNDEKKIALSDFVIENTNLQTAKAEADNVLTLLKQLYD